MTSTALTGADSTALAIRDEEHYLLTVREVRMLAERIDDVDDAKALADKAAAAQVWARRAKLGQEQVNLAGIAKLWAERRAGELLAAMPKHAGGRPREHFDNPATWERSGAYDPETPRQDRVVSLAELGISHDQSSEWQKLAEIPANDFQAAVDEAAAEGPCRAPRSWPSTIHRRPRSGRHRRSCSTALTLNLHSYWMSARRPRTRNAPSTSRRKWTASVRIGRAPSG